MKSKVRFPFVYFYTEPLVIYVYKMASSEYLSVRYHIEMQAYEVEDKKAFESFKHEECSPVAGRGYFMSLSGRYEMIEEINDYIQHYRSLLSCKPFSRDKYKEANSVHIVSSESAAGTVRVGLQNPKVVIGFTEFLAIGPLWNLDKEDGQAHRYEWLFEHINNEQEDYLGENKFRNMLREIEVIPDRLPIYIWYGNNAFEQAFMRFVIYIIRHKPNDIYLINSAELKYKTNKYEHEEAVYTGHLEPHDVRIIFDNRKELQSLTEQERVHFQNEWDTISQTKSVLRIWSNQRITEVNEDYYDELILNTIKRMHQEQDQKEFIMTADVIGEILSIHKKFIHIDYLEYRVRDLVYSGFLELKGVPKSMHHYRVKLRT